MGGVSTIVQALQSERSNLRQFFPTDEGMKPDFAKFSVLKRYWDKLSAVIPEGTCSIPISQPWDFTGELQHLHHIHKAKFKTEAHERITTGEKLEAASKHVDVRIATDAGVELNQRGAAGAGWTMEKQENKEVIHRWERVKDESLMVGVGHSSYSAELVAATRALWGFVEIFDGKLNHLSLLLVSDSLSMLTHMATLSPRNLWELEFLRALDAAAKTTGGKITLQHVSAHVGIVLNERADKLATSGLEAQKEKDETLKVAKPKHIKEQVKKALTQAREEDIQQVIREETNSKSGSYRWYWRASRDENERKISLKDCGGSRSFQRFRNQLIVGRCSELSKEHSFYAGAGNTCRKCGGGFKKTWRLTQHFILHCDHTDWCRGGCKYAGCDVDPLPIKLMWQAELLMGEMRS